MQETITCRVTRGELKNDDAVALEMALDDLRVYWEKAFGVGSFLLGDEQPECEADMDLLIGTAGNLPAIAALEEGGGDYAGDPGVVAGGRGDLQALLHRVLAQGGDDLLARGGEGALGQVVADEVDRRDESLGLHREQAGGAGAERGVVGDALDALGGGLAGLLLERVPFDDEDRKIRVTSDGDIRLAAIGADEYRREYGCKRVFAHTWLASSD